MTATDRFTYDDLAEVTRTDDVPVVETFDGLRWLDCREQVRTHPADPVLVVAQLGYGQRTDWPADRDALVAAIEAAPAETVVLTTDGRHVAEPLTWHDGADPDPDGWVYYERWSASGRDAHGYIHPESRRLLQSG